MSLGIFIFLLVGWIAYATYLKAKLERARRVSYFLEYDTDPSFPAPHVIDLGASRKAFMFLPLSDGKFLFMRFKKLKGVGSGG